MKIERIEATANVVTVSAGGLTSALPGSAKLPLVLPLLEELVVPFAVGREVGDVAGFVDGVYRHQRNYKWSGAAFWLAVAHVEVALWDLLGQAAGKPVCALLGEVRRERVPVYLSSMRRDNTGEAEAARMAEACAAVGARAAKVKIGGRMSRDADASPGRSEAVVRATRRALGDGATLYVDANGSYSAGCAIDVAAMLADHGVAWFEEPCEWEEVEAVRRVTDAGLLPVAAGEQECRASVFRWMCEHRGVDVVQADPYYNGGLLRTLRVAELAAAAGLGFSPHSPQPESLRASVQLLAVLGNATPFLEYHVDRDLSPIKGGEIAVPMVPGLGEVV